MLNIIRLLLYLLALFLLSSSCNSKMKSYTVKKISQAIEITGEGTDKTWKKANKLKRFSYPWRTETAPATTFRALYTNSHLYFLYRATDDEIIAKEKRLGERDVVDSDRVEIFFKADDKMNPYYTLEMDALGRVLDSEVHYHRKFNLNLELAQRTFYPKNNNRPRRLLGRREYFFSILA